MVQEGERTRDIISYEGQAAKNRGQPDRSALPWHEKLLLASMLLVVAGWIIFRLLLTFFTAH
jgi:hypothetical protein